MKIGHYQLECTAGDYAKNMGKILAGLAEADKEGIEILSFPESFLTGYFDSVEKTRKHSFAADGPEIRDFLQHTADFRATFMVGFSERRGEELFNSVLVAERGERLGIYSKAFPCVDFFTPGREFPVFVKGGVKFGVVICADGGYIEPTRILALKGAQIVFAPHYNYIKKEGLIGHFQKVRSDHTARAVENGVWFLRGNNVCSGLDEGLGYEGVGYGDSYLVDPSGEIVVRSQRHVECLIYARVDLDEKFPETRRSVMSGRQLGGILMQTLEASDIHIK